MPTRARLALIAFAFHAPGLKLLANHSLSRGALAANVVAIAATLILMAQAAITTGLWTHVLKAWLIGHFAWSFVLAVFVYCGTTSASSAKTPAASPSETE